MAMVPSRWGSNPYWEPHWKHQRSSEEPDPSFSLNLFSMDTFGIVEYFSSCPQTPWKYKNQQCINLSLNALQLPSSVCATLQSPGFPAEHIHFNCNKSIHQVFAYLKRLSNFLCGRFLPSKRLKFSILNNVWHISSTFGPIPIFSKECSQGSEEQKKDDMRDWR